MATVLGGSMFLGAVVKMMSVLIGISVIAWAYRKKRRIAIAATAIITVAILVAMGFHARWTLALVI